MPFVRSVQNTALHDHFWRCRRLYDRCSHNDHAAHILFYSSLVVLLWFGGVVVGMFLFHAAGDIYVSWMRSCFDGSVSIVGELAAFFLPVFFCAIAALYGKPLIIYSIVFVKAIFYSAATFGCYAAFGASAWLVQQLILFCDNLSAVFLILSAFCSVRGSSQTFVKRLGIWSIAGFAAMFFNHSLILPLIEAL